VGIVVFIIIPELATTRMNMSVKQLIMPPSTILWISSTTRSVSASTYAAIPISASTALSSSPALSPRPRLLPR
jgi:hypothetical protein